MWCSHCGQDVRARTSAEAGQFECPRCKAGICDRMAAPLAARESPPRKATATPIASSMATLASFGRSPTPAFDLWVFDEELRHAARLLGLKRADRPKAGHTRFDPAHRAVMAAPHPKFQAALSPHGPELPASFRIMAGAASLALWLGIVALTCGVVLMGWSIWAGQQALWDIALPICSCGICALSAGTLARTAWTQPTSGVAPMDPLYGGHPGMPQDGPRSRPRVGRHAGRTA